MFSKTRRPIVLVRRLPDAPGETNFRLEGAFAYEGGEPHSSWTARVLRTLSSRIRK